MAQQVETRRVRYPLVAYNFQVTIGGRAMSFSKVSGLQLEHETVTYRHGMSAWYGEQIAVYNVDKFIPLTLERGTLASGDLFLYDWFGNPESTSMDISLCDEHASPIVTWQVATAYPVKLSTPGFSADSSEVSIDTLEVMAAGIEIIA